MHERQRGAERGRIDHHGDALFRIDTNFRTRAVAHIKRIRTAAKNYSDITVFAGIEVDILADGTLDLSDSVLEQMDVVIASVHSHFQQEPAQMTDRLLRAISNPNTSIIGHPTGRVLLRREGYTFDMDAS